MGVGDQRRTQGSGAHDDPGGWRRCAGKRVIWIKARPDFDVLFQLLDNLRVDEERRLWIAYPEAKDDACDIREDMGREGMEVKIMLQMSHNISTIAEEYIQW